MSTVDRFFLRWLSPALFGIWSAFLLYLLATGRYTMFLRPEFGWLLMLAHFIAMGLMVAALPISAGMELDGRGALRAAVLLVPVLYLMNLPADTLGSRVFINRFMGVSDTVAPQSGRPEKPGPMDRPAAGMHRPDRELTILDLMMRAEQYDGHQVVVTGMMLHDEKLKQYFGGRHTAVYRFLINCCAADALPLAVALDSRQAGSVATDQWVRVEGVFHLREADGEPVPVIEDAALFPVDAPRAPYLY